MPEIKKSETHCINGIGHLKTVKLNQIGSKSKSNTFSSGRTDQAILLSNLLVVIWLLNNPGVEEDVETWGGATFGKFCNAARLAALHAHSLA